MVSMNENIQSINYSSSTNIVAGVGNGDTNSIAKIRTARKVRSDSGYEIRRRSIRKILYVFSSDVAHNSCGSLLGNVDFGRHEIS